MGMANDYEELRRHIGHKVVCVCYGKDSQAPDNVAIECEDCGGVLLDYDRPEVFEICPHCDTEVELEPIFKKQKCPNCGKLIKPCDMCAPNKWYDCNKCPLGPDSEVKNQEKQKKLKGKKR